MMTLLNPFHSWKKKEEAKPIIVDIDELKKYTWERMRLDDFDYDDDNTMVATDLKAIDYTMPDSKHFVYFDISVVATKIGKFSPQITTLIITNLGFLNVESGNSVKSNINESQLEQVMESYFNRMML